MRDFGSEFTAFLVRLALQYWRILGMEYKEGKADEIKSSYTALNQPKNHVIKFNRKTTRSLDVLGWERDPIPIQILTFRPLCNVNISAYLWCLSLGWWLNLNED